jgi:hypothetical protein
MSLPVCANCQNTAVYTYAASPEHLTNYCESCLPNFLRKPEYTALVSPAAEVVEEPTPKAKTTKKTVVEETPEEAPVEAPAAEEAPAEEAK